MKNMNSRILKRANFAAIVAMTVAVLFATSTMAASFQVLHSFAGPEGETPAAPLIQGADGFFSGVAAHGGDFTVLSLDGGGETVTVTTLDDVSDFSGLQQVSDLPGPDGRVSFREAVTAANNTPGAQTIAFAIPPAEFWLVPDVGLLRLEQGAFFLNDSGTTVDFSTQTANMGDTNPNGPEIGIYGLETNGWGIAAIFMNGDNGVVKGLGKVYQRGYAVRIVGNNNRVIGCQIDGPLHAAVSVSGYMGWPPPSGNIVGGTAPGEGNSLIGLVIDGPAEGNIVIGNTLLVGVEVRGATQYGVFARNNRIGGPTPAERNVIAGAGSYGEEGFPDGAQVSIVDADGTLVEGNYIGTTADGMHPYPQQIGPVGVEVRDSRNTTIRANLVAGLRVVGTDHYAGQIFGQAISIGATNLNNQGTVVQGNTIGLAADGVTPIVTRSGIIVSPMSSFYHAFSTLINSNHIASVETIGVFVAALENGVTITRNSIHDCGALGIDLGTTAGADGAHAQRPRRRRYRRQRPAELPRAPVGRDDRFNGHGSGNARLLAQRPVHGRVLREPLVRPVRVRRGRRVHWLDDGDNRWRGARGVLADVAGRRGGRRGSHRDGHTPVHRRHIRVFRLHCGDVAWASRRQRVGHAHQRQRAVDGAVQFGRFERSRWHDRLLLVELRGRWQFDRRQSEPHVHQRRHLHRDADGDRQQQRQRERHRHHRRQRRATPYCARPRSTCRHASREEGQRDRNVVVRDGNGAAVSGAVVSATWAMPGGATAAQAATTSSTGIAKFSTSGGRGTYALTVSNISNRPATRSTHSQQHHGRRASPNHGRMISERAALLRREGLDGRRDQGSIRKGCRGSGTPSSPCS